MMYRITPQAREIHLLLTLLDGMSHADPNDKAGSNTKTFNRKTKTFPLPATSIEPPTVAEINAIAARFPVPGSVVGHFSDLSAYQFFAAALLWEFIDRHGMGPGSGLFSGVERYTMLAKRVSTSATFSLSLDRWWSRLHRDMEVVHQTRDETEMRLFAILGRRGLDVPVLNELRHNLPYIMMIARLWREAFFDDMDTALLAQPLTFDRNNYEYTGQITMDIPEYSANSARHEMVREPGMWHLLNALGLRLEDLPSPAAAMLYNGGAMSGVAPSGVFGLQRKIKDAYPLLGLISGSADTFMIGAGTLEVNTALVAREYADELALFGLGSNQSVFDLLDVVTRTRHNGGGVVDVSPMPFGYEVLVPGTKIAVAFRLRPYATELELGALVAALQTYVNADSTIGGQSAKGHGLVSAEIIREIPGMNEQAEAYEAYLAANRDRLRQGLVDGTLATGVGVVGARPEKPERAERPAKPVRGKGKADVPPPPAFDGDLFGGIEVTDN